MTQLATLDDLTPRLGRDLTDAELLRADSALTDVSAAVRAYTGQQFLIDEITARLPVRRNKIRLPQRPVTAVDTVDDVDGNSLEFTWDAGDVVYLDSVAGRAFELETVPRRLPLRWADVTYTAGYETVPDDIVAVVCSIAARSLGATPEHAGVTSMSLGDAAIGYGTVGASGALGMFDGERAVLDRYRRIGGTILIS